PRHERLAAPGRLPPEEVVALGQQMLAGLAHLHAQGVMHRDIKPANLFLCRDGTLKLLDFGLVRGEEHTAITGQGEVVGTLSYLAPELVVGKDATPASDMWSVGCVLYRMLCGVRPVEADDRAALVALAFRATAPVALWLMTRAAPPPPPPPSAAPEPQPVASVAENRPLTLTALCRPHRALRSSLLSNDHAKAAGAVTRLRE